MLVLNCLAGQYIAVLETIGAVETLNRDERLLLTDELRRIAVEKLPGYMGYTIMTRENIKAMLPPDKSVEDCEGSCLVETGKNISADFVAQARLGKFGKSLSVTVELYETSSGKLMSSFIGKGMDAEDLLKEIEIKAPALFSVVKEEPNFSGGSEGFSGVQQGTSYTMDGNRQFLVNVKSVPAGAMVSVDGRPKCKSTPCKLHLLGGKHTFSFALDMYSDMDSVIDIHSNEQNLYALMKPNFGTLELVPQMRDYGKKSELSITVDGEKQKTKILHLSVGKYHVELSHPCYEPVSFDVNIKKGSELKFDHVMQPALGGLSLAAEGKGGPISVPVFVDGKEMGKTPFRETVPICSRIEIGKDKDSLPVKMKYHETVEFVFKEHKENAPKDRDGNVYKTVRIGQQIWMAENLNEKTYGSWCFKNESDNCKKYGRLYNWETAKKVCPMGWRLPSKGDFEKLFSAIGGLSTAGMMLKSKIGWNKKGNGTDNYSFAALPAGIRYDDENSGNMGLGAYFWSSTVRGGDGAYSMYLLYDENIADFDISLKEYGLSVRCIKD